MALYNQQIGVIVQQEVSTVNKLLSQVKRGPVQSKNGSYTKMGLTVQIQVCIVNKWVLQFIIWFIKSTKGVSLFRSGSVKYTNGFQSSEKSL